MFTTVAAALVLGFLLATAYGAAFHLIAGGKLRHIPLFLIASWAGFLLGHFAGDFLGVQWLRLGVLQLFAGSIGAWLALIFSRWLVTVE